MEGGRLLLAIGLVRSARPAGFCPACRVLMKALDTRQELAKSMVAALAVLAVAGVAWVAMVRQSHSMAGMDMGLGPIESFAATWVVMMAAMMLPSLVPMLWRYRQAVGRTGETRLGRLTALVGVGYFSLWTVVGLAAFPLGVGLAALEMQQPALARAVPIAVGVVVLIAGALQFTAWKTRHLACCREAPGRGRALPGDAGMETRPPHGLCSPSYRPVSSPRKSSRRPSS